MLFVNGQAEVIGSKESGVLEYVNGFGSVYRSIRFKRADGSMFNPFDEGLKFYDLRMNSLSPDKKYSIVSFSAEGDLTESSRASKYSQYLCAFVRMKDGGIVHVAQDAVCGGAWRQPHQWSVNIEPIFDHQPNVADIDAANSSKHKSGYQTSQPPILAYLAEGTLFDNLLACDPPSAGNRSAYSKLLIQLQRDGDTENAAKLNRILIADRNSAPIRVAPDESSAWVVHAVISGKEYLYVFPDKSEITRVYLVRGDSVLVDESSLLNGLVLSRYRQKSGSVIERWIECEDVSAYSTGN